MMRPSRARQAAAGSFRCRVTRFSAAPALRIMGVPDFRKGVGVVTEGQLSVVAVYELVGTQFERVAEFRLNASGVVDLMLAEPDGCPMAQEWFDKGLRLRGRSQPVTPQEGRAFLEAVLQPRRMSYCAVVDESPGR